MNNRFDNGVGKGVKYYQAQLKKKKANRGRSVMFELNDEPGTSMPDDCGSPVSPKKNTLSPKKELDKRY